ncbi:MAG: helix-turn-helix domain-containing protein [Clostridiales bacterium]|nr:helix-turn-helix domain-containing protein [Clostridiales bacterium]
MEAKTIGKFIAVLRKANGMTQKELAEKLNVSDKAVSRWEREESLPDLTLVPVIAELFQITADELLRGERRSAGDPANTSTFSSKGEKQIAHMLSDGKTRLMIRSMISVGLCIAGFIGASITNFGFYRGYIGFFIGCAFYAAAVLCEVCFFISAFGKVSGDDFESEALNRYKHDSLHIVKNTVSLAVVLFGATLPLIIWPEDAYQGILLPDWAIDALLFGGVFAVIAWIASMMITVIAERKGLYRPSDEKQEIRSHRRKLKLKIAGITLLVVAGTAIGQAVFNAAVPVSSLVEGTVFTDFESFRVYMEADVHDETYSLDSGEAVSIENEGYEDYEGISSDIEWTNDNGETWETLEYTWRNTTVAEIVTDRASANGNWEVRVLTNGDYTMGENRKARINMIWTIAYMIEIAAGVIIYLRKNRVTL